MKHIKNFRPLALAFILVVTGIAAAVCGLVMKGQLQKYVGGYDDKWAVAVPFLMLRDDTDWQRMLAAKNAPAPDPQPDPEPEPDPEPIPELLTLVNPWNQVPEDWTVDLVTLPNGLEIDKRCYDALMDMIDGCYDAGLTPVICSAYRTQDFQQTLHDNKVSEWMEQGYSREEAREKAGHQVAVPGTSEHQLGLAVDIVDVNYQLLDTNQENTAVQKWLLENSWRYGFILRYPTDQTDVTGIVYEPWHYRYVGKEYAQDIYKKGLCLEQYLEQWGK